MPTYEEIVEQLMKFEPLLEELGYRLEIIPLDQPAKLPKYSGPCHGQPIFLRNGIWRQGIGLQPGDINVAATESLR